MKDYYKDKESGDIFTEQEMLEAVDSDDQLNSFYLIGQFKSKKAAKKHVINKNNVLTDYGRKNLY